MAVAQITREEFEKIYEAAIPGPEAMPKRLLRRAHDGTIIALSYAEILLSQALRLHGPDAPVGYPDTAYYLPVIRCLSGEGVTRLGELVPILNRMRSQVRDELTFANARLWGESTLYAAEIIEAMHYLVKDEPKVEPWTGFLPDPAVRRYGIKLVDWTIPGQAVILGKARSSKEAAKIVEEIMGNGLMIFASDEIIEQCLEENVKLGVDYIAFPIGNFTQVIHAVNYALRAGMAFGGIPPGLREQHRDYQHRRVRAFVLQLGEVDEVKVAAHFGAIFLGFPVILDTVVDEEIKDWYVSHPDYSDIVKFCMETRGIKLVSAKPNIPLNFGPSFEGETIRKPDCYFEMGNGKSPTFELVRMVDLDHVKDGQVEVIGPEVDGFPEGANVPIGTIVDIYGRKMQADFESVLERRIHYFTNYAEGLWHTAQRDMTWLRVSKEAIAKGFKFRHFGDLLIAKFKAEFPAIVDRVQVTILTDPAKVLEALKTAKKKYLERDQRMQGLTDDKVDEFYTCTLCQSFAPTHACIIAPERVGLCGAVTWLDAKASLEINPTGPNQPIVKGPALDDERGMWASVNDIVNAASRGNIPEVNLYTFLDKPMTSCGCFESIIAIFPEANGIMVTTREHKGMTPCGMTFSTLAGQVGGGLQTPGFMGVGRTYILSKRFIVADGGLARVAWMPKELKSYLIDRGFRERCEQAGLGADFIDKIADESAGTTPEEVVAFLSEKGHPCLSLPSII